jgi:hypothetical protein
VMGGECLVGAQGVRVYGVAKGVVNGV